jgi:hypothetical protein
VTQVTPLRAGLTVSTGGIGPAGFSVLACIWHRFTKNRLYYSVVLGEYLGKRAVFELLTHPGRDIREQFGFHSGRLQRGHGTTTPNLLGGKRAMKNILDVLKQKEIELLQVQKEVEALRMVARLLADETQAAEAANAQKPAAAGTQTAAPQPARTAPPIPATVPREGYPAWDAASKKFI